MALCAKHALRREENERLIVIGGQVRKERLVSVSSPSRERERAGGQSWEWLSSRLRARTWSRLAPALDASLTSLGTALVTP